MVHTLPASDSLWPTHSWHDVIGKARDFDGPEMDYAERIVPGIDLKPTQSDTLVLTVALSPERVERGPGLRSPNALRGTRPDFLEGKDEES
jgi:hypothetical protein